MPSDSETFIEQARRDSVRGSTWTVITTLVSTPVGLAANVVLARFLGVHGLGTFGTDVSLFALVMLITNLGWSEATVQWLAAATARGHADERLALIRRSSGFHMLVSGPLSAVCAFWLVRRAGLPAEIIGPSVVWVMQALGTSTVINTASARNALSAQLALIANLTTQIALVTCAVASREATLTWTVQLACYVLGPMLATIRLPRLERNALLRPQLRLRTPHGFRVYAASACVSGILATLVYGRSEIILLHTDGFSAAAGLFSVITGLAGQMTGVLDSALAPLTPIAAALVAIDRARAVRAFQRALRITSLFGVTAATVLMPLGVLAIRLLYGRAFDPATAPFTALALVSSFQTALGPATAFAFATRSAAQVLRVNALCLVFDATLAFALIPSCGLWGAVAANAGAGTLSLVLMLRLVSRRLHLPAAILVGCLRFFWVGLAISAVEAAVLASLSGEADVLALPMAVVAVATLWLLLICFPRFRLDAGDVDMVSGPDGSRKLRLVLSVISRAGLVRAPADPTDLLP